MMSYVKQCQIVKKIETDPQIQIWLEVLPGQR